MAVFLNGSRKGTKALGLRQVEPETKGGVGLEGYSFLDGEGKVRIVVGGPVERNELPPAS